MRDKKKLSWLNKGGILMLQKRNIGLALILTILTCGLYSIYWFVKLTDEAKYLSGNQEEVSGGMALLLTIVTCGIYILFWNYKMGKTIYMAQERAGSMKQDNSVLYLVLGIFQLTIISYCIMQSDINNVIQYGYAY